MPDYSKIYLYRMMHIGNIPHIIQHGITHRDSINANPEFIPIGDTSLISSRSEFILDNGNRLGDYIPFYFGPRTPMLYVIQKGYNMVNATASTDIVYCISSVQQVLNSGRPFVFTNGHAVDSYTEQFDESRIEEIDNIVDRKAVMAKYWKDENDLDLKRRKEAEFLVLGDLSKETILGYAVVAEQTKQRMVAYGVPAEKIHIKPGFYF